MQLRILQEGRRILVCSLLWRTVRGSDYHDARLAQRQTPGTYIEPVTATVTVFTQFTVTETATVTVTPTNTIPTTVVSTESITTTTVTTETTSVEVSKRRRQAAAGHLTTTSTTTLWQFPDATETLTITATDLQSAREVTTTQVVTEVVVVTAKETVVASSSSSSSSLLPAESAVNRPDPLGVVDPNTTREDASGVHLAMVLGTVFGSLIGAIAIFVAGFLWAKKRQEKLQELEEVAVSAPPGGGGGGRVAGLLGSVLGSTRSSTHYNTIPDAAMFLAASRQLPPQLPPVDLDPPSDYSFDVHYGAVPQLPALHIPPPRQSAFAYDYTFGSPVSSISEGFTQTSAGREMASRANWPPPPATLGGEGGLSLTSEAEPLP